ncbi:uncharacterized protein [Rutidosis leptorrhynchoides]|uniref:uncharacterized protein n=1 Tax=Rutidosis leptorrhynchoides TaxID=125765 RepID=UPI003A998C69
MSSSRRPVEPVFLPRRYGRLAPLSERKSSEGYFGLGVHDTALDEFVQFFGCSKGTFPLAYLGLPIGFNVNTPRNWKPLCDQFRKKFSGWKASLLSIGERYTLLKSVLGSLGIYHLSLFKCLETVFKELEGLRAKCFWGSSDSNKKMHWISWDIALNALENGGIEISSLRALNLGLIFKWVWRFTSCPNTF